MKRQEFIEKYAPNYRELKAEQKKECDNIVACSMSKNGMNPDGFFASGLMQKFEDDMFELALTNYTKTICKEQREECVRKFLRTPAREPFDAELAKKECAAILNAPQPKID